MLHNLEDYAHSAIKVVNGFHTGRTEGAPITDLALQMLEKMRKQKGGPPGHHLFHPKPKGRAAEKHHHPHSWRENRIIGLLCINFYLNTTIHQIVRELSAAPASLDAVQHQEYPENFTANVSALIENSVSAVQQEVNQDHSIPSAAKNKEIVRRLDAKGIFALKDGVVKSAELLQISKTPCTFICATSQMKALPETRTVKAAHRPVGSLLFLFRLPGAPPGRFLLTCQGPLGILSPEW